jgi:hypothetical protein
MRISVIGSCRVQDPLMARGVVLDQAGIGGYTHNTGEHLQLLSNPPLVPQTVPLVRMVNLPMEREAVDTSDPDRWFVVEVCSVRIVKYESWYLQINRFGSYVRDLAGPDFSSPNFKSQAALRAQLAQIPNLPFDSERIEYYEQAEDELYADALAIHRQLGGRVLFVSHWDTDHKGAKIGQRTVIRNALNRLALDEGVFFLDPTPYARRTPGAFVDLGHYADSFKPIIGRVIANRLSEVMGVEPLDLVAAPAGSGAVG